MKQSVLYSSNYGAVNQSHEGEPDGKEVVGGTGFEPVTSAMCLDSSPDLLVSYLAHLDSRGLSEHYTFKINEYIGKYLRNFKEVSTKSAESFLLRSNHLKPRTKARYSTYLRGFLNHFGIPFDIKVKIPRTLPPYVSEADIRKLYETIRDKETHKESCFRDLTLLDTAIMTGMRRGELADLRIKDLSFEANRVFVRKGKGDRDRVIPMHPKIKDDLRLLCGERQPEERVFQMLPRSLGMKFHKWAKKADVPLHTHSFRHYFATKLVEKGANIRVVQELLGHSSLNTTQVYLSVTANHLEEAIGLLDE